jgi:hypothetical protein
VIVERWIDEAALGKHKNGQAFANLSRIAKNGGLPLSSTTWLLSSALRSLLSWQVCGAHVRRSDLSNYRRPFVCGTVG